MTLGALLRADMFPRRNAGLPLFRTIWLLAFGRDGRACMGLFRLSHHMWVADRKWLARRIRDHIQKRFASSLHPAADLGPGVRLPHPFGVVIGRGVQTGPNCIIYHQVTLGGAGFGEEPDLSRYPKVGADVVLWAGAKLLGPITLGDRAQVGANAVVTKDVPADTIARGVPARNFPR